VDVDVIVDCWLYPCSREAGRLPLLDRVSGVVGPHWRSRSTGQLDSPWATEASGSLDSAEHRGRCREV